MEIREDTHIKITAKTLAAMIFLVILATGLVVILATSVTLNRTQVKTPSQAFEYGGVKVGGGTAVGNILKAQSQTVQNYMTDGVTSEDDIDPSNLDITKLRQGDYLIPR